MVRVEEVKSEHGARGDIMAIEVTMGRESCLIINVYNDEYNTAVDRLYMPYDASRSTIITGDFNLHHPHWSPDHCHESPHADALTDWMATKGFVLVNDPGTITFLRGRDTSTLDLTWVNMAIIDSGLVTDWKVHNEMDHASDHFPVSNLEHVHPHRTPGKHDSSPLPKIHFFPEQEEGMEETVLERCQHVRS